MCEVCNYVRSTEEYIYAIRSLHAAAPDDDQWEILEDAIFSLVLNYEIKLAAVDPINKTIVDLIDNLEEDDDDAVEGMFLLFPPDGDRLN